MKLQLPMIGSPSRTETACRCRRRHLLQNVLGLEKYTSPSLLFGTVMHEAVAKYWESDQDYTTALIALRDIWRKLRPEGAKHTMAVAESMLRTYAQNANLSGPFAGDDWEIMTIEERKEIEVGGVVLSFKMDRLVYSPSTDTYALLDLKTASKINDRWHKTYDRSLQLKLYTWATKQIVKRPVLCGIEGLEKVMPSRLIYHVAPPWDDAVLQEAVDEFVEQTIKDAIIVEECELDPDKVMDYALTKSSFNYFDCFSYWIECPYYSLCMTTPSLRRMIADSDYYIAESDLDEK